MFCSFMLAAALLTAEIGYKASVPLGMKPIVVAHAKIIHNRGDMGTLPIYIRQGNNDYYEVDGWADKDKFLRGYLVENQDNFHVTVTGWTYSGPSRKYIIIEKITPSVLTNP